MSDLQTEVKNATDVLKSGGLILYPTDTIWGIGCDATNEKAVSRIYDLKKRTDSKSMIILLENENRIPSYVQFVPEPAWTLIEFSEKPLTIIYDHAKNLAPNLLNADGSIAIRVTKDEFCKQLIHRFRKPIVSTSANISGEDFPENFSKIKDEILSGVDYIVNLRQDERGKSRPSAIIRLKENGEFRFIRK